MIVLDTQDKSGYATLKGLFKLIEKDVADKKKELERYSERSRDYAACKGAIGALNSTLSLILVTDVWTQGQRQDNIQSHWHAIGPDTEYLASTPSLLRGMLVNHGFRVTDAFDMAEAGYSVRMCKEQACLISGKWVAKPTSTLKTP